MVRVWNYNKSRIHAARGARQVELYLDSTMLFMGEIRQAPGNLADAEENAEVRGGGDVVLLSLRFDGTDFTLHKRS